MQKKNNKSGRLILKVFLAGLLVALSQPASGQMQESGSGQGSDLSDIAGRLRTLGSIELNYWINHNLQYGGIADLIKSGDLPETVTTKNVIPGCETHWYLNKGNTNFAIVVVPSDPSMPYLMINNELTVLALAPADQSNLSTWAGNLVIKAETEAFNATNRYGWLDSLGLNESTGSLELFLSEEETSFLLTDLSFSNNSLGGYVYLENTSTLYNAVEYKPGLPLDIEATVSRREQALKTGSEAREKLLWFAEREWEFFNASPEKRFATFDELIESGIIDKGESLDSLLDGYRSILYLKPDKSDFILLAMPVRNLNVLSPLILDSRRVVGKLTPVNKFLTTKWQVVINYQEKYFKETQSYTPVVTELSDDEKTKLFIYLDQKFASFLLTDIDSQEEFSYEARGSRDVYLSTTKRIYAWEPVPAGHSSN